MTGGDGVGWGLGKGLKLLEKCFWRYTSKFISNKKMEIWNQYIGITTTVLENLGDH